MNIIKTKNGITNLSLKDRHTSKNMISLEYAFILV